MTPANRANEQYKYANVVIHVLIIHKCKTIKCEMLWGIIEVRWLLCAVRQRNVFWFSVAHFVVMLEDFTGSSPGLWDSWMLNTHKQRLHLWMKKMHLKCSSHLKPICSKLRIKARVIRLKCLQTPGDHLKTAKLFSVLATDARLSSGNAGPGFWTSLFRYHIWEGLEPGGLCSGPSWAVCQLLWSYWISLCHNFLLCES